MKKINAKYQFLLIIMLSFGILAACSGGEATPTAEPADTLVEPTRTVPSLATVAPKNTAYPEPQIIDPYPALEPDSSYPAPDLLPGYPAPELPPGYPAPEEPEPPIDPYPDGFVVIIKPIGVQCEDYDLPDVDLALAELEDAGINVLEGRETELMVCSACGCPTSLHYTANIDPAGLDIALSLGWEEGS